MVQFNLLPDVKLEYVRARRTQRLVVVIATLASAAALTLFVLLLLFVNVAQKKHLRDLDKDISSNSKTLKNTKDLNRILTVQNQLNSLPGLDAQKPANDRLFDYVTQLTPSKAYITDLEVDYTQNQLTLTGTADSLDTVNTYVDTLKFTTYQITGQSDQPKAFSNVVLSAFNRNTDQASYTIVCNFDPAIFNIANKVTLTVPKVITTRSELNQPQALFEAAPSTKVGGN